MIEEILRELYKAPVEFRWALANSGLQKIMTGEAWDVSPFGRRGRLIRRLVGFAGVFGGVRTGCCGGCRLRSHPLDVFGAAIASPWCYLSLAAYLSASAQGLKKQMWHAFAEESGDAAIRLDETTGDFPRISSSPDIVRYLNRSGVHRLRWFPFSRRQKLEPVASNRKDTLTYAALKMGRIHPIPDLVGKRSSKPVFPKLFLFRGNTGIRLHRCRYGCG